MPEPVRVDLRMMMVGTDYSKKLIQQTATFQVGEVKVSITWDLHIVNQQIPFTITFDSDVVCHYYDGTQEL